MKPASNRTKAPGDAWMTLQAAADGLGLSRSGTLSLIVKGDLIGKHVAGRTVVSRESLAVLLAARESSAA